MIDIKKRASYTFYQCFASFCCGEVPVQACRVSRTTNLVKGVNFTSRAETIELSRQVFQSFNTWAFKRQQPTEPAKLLLFIEGAVLRSEPIQFVLYWGKGPRSTVAEPEYDCLRYLCQMGERIRAVYPPGACFTLIATDTHATHNVHPGDAITSYFLDVTEAASEFGYSLCYLSATVNAQRSRISGRASIPSADVLGKLEPCAEKWYKGEGTSSYGAVRYHEMNMLEKQAVELEFPRAIFITFNSSDFRELFPEQLPVFYMYSLRKGSSVKPWFVNIDQLSASQPGKSESDVVAGII